MGHETAKFRNFGKSSKINENSYNDNFFEAVVKETKEIYISEKKLGGQLHFKKT